MVVGDASQVARPVFREGQDSFGAEKLPGKSKATEKHEEEEPSLWQSMFEFKDFHLFVLGSVGLICLNGFIAAYFSIHSDGIA